MRMPSACGAGKSIFLRFCRYQPAQRNMQSANFMLQVATAQGISTVSAGKEHTFEASDSVDFIAPCNHFKLLLLRILLDSAPAGFTRLSVDAGNSFPQFW
jgi:hypothetical protein